MTTTSTVDPRASRTRGRHSTSLRTFALAAAASAIQQVVGASDGVEMRYLHAHLDAIGPDGAPWQTSLDAYLERPGRADAALVALAHGIGMTRAEILAVALASAVEDDPMAGRAVAFLQAPIGGSRPTLALAAAIAATFDECRGALGEIAAGAAQRCGVIVLHGEGPLAERVIGIPAPTALALRRVDAEWPGVAVDMGEWPETPLPPSILEQAGRHARALSSTPARAIAIRSGSSVEARAAACAIARQLHRRAAFIETDRHPGIGPWLFLRDLLPVFLVDLAPGEHRKVGDIPGYRGPVLAVCGPDGTIEVRGEAAASWRLPTPSAAERAHLWERALDDEALGRQLGAGHRHSSGRIAELGRTARQLAMLDGRTQPERRDVTAAAKVAETPLLGALAQPIVDEVGDEALVVPPAVRRDLQALVTRCRGRETVVDGLGPAASARYHPGVRALFVGPSGTGKTLAASWLATALAVPLYRVDLAAVTSKYIGETEKQLAQLIARAEHAEIALLFDEADSLFGKRTEVKDSNDRFANAQTNYLLQRIESFDGIAILTSNSRARFDSAFSRRLDTIIDFPAPGPEERRALWLAHLGNAHSLDGIEINRLAATADLAGGHIRNAVLAAATAARAASRVISYADVVRGLAAEYRKLGRQVPAGFAATRE